MITVINNRIHNNGSSGYEFTPTVNVWTSSKPTKLPLPLPPLPPPADNKRVGLETDALDYVFIEIINMRGIVTVKIGEDLVNPRLQISLPKDDRPKHIILGFLVINSVVSSLVSSPGKAKTSVTTTENISIEENDPGS